MGIAVVTVLCLLVSTPLSVIGALPEHLPSPQWPEFTPGLLVDVAGPAITVAVLAAIESLLSARVAAGMGNTGAYNPDRELFGQGIASIGSGTFGGMPATGAIARTAVNVRSGGRSRLAAITHALALLVVVLVVAKPVAMIPLAGLAGVLILTAWRMVNWTVATSILRSTGSDAAAFILTAIITVAFDLIVAVIIGVIVAGIFTIRNLTRTSSVHREQITDKSVPGDHRIAIIRFHGPLVFTSADRVFEEILRIQDVNVVILRMSTVEYVDATGAHILSDIVETLERRGITVLIKGVQPAHNDLFRTVGVLASLRHHKHLFTELPAAIEHARDHIRREDATTD